MTENPAPVRASPLRGVPSQPQVDPRVAVQAAVDLRVSMVLAVLGGRSVEDVAREWDLESSLVHRWVRDFLVAGTAAITNKPDPDEARQRDRFLAAFAHELRTPVAVAHGWAVLLADGDVPESQVPDSLARLTDALGRLSRHIQDVELSASTSLGRVRVTLETVDLGALCRELAGAPAVRRGAEVRVQADPRLLGRVLRDLWAVANQDPTPQAVAVDVVESGPWHEIRIVRQGAPLSPLVLRALLDPFGSNDDATGVTIGLYLARVLTVAHRGFLGAEGDDDETVLFVRLPREPARESAGEPAREPAGDPAVDHTKPASDATGPDVDKGGKP